MNEREEMEGACFPLDLSREEYVAYYRLFARFTGADRSKYLWAGVLCALLAGEVLLSVWDAGVSWTEKGILLGCLLLALWYLLAGIPWMRRRHAGKVYDRATAGGQIFEGVFTITPLKAVKETPSGRFELTFANGAIFAETKDMQCFLNATGRSIVLPARCLTPEDAETVRALAAAAIPPEFYRLYQPVQAERTERMPMPELKEDVLPLMTVHVAYRPEEMQRLMKTLSRRAFVSAFPPYVTVAFILALLLGMFYGFMTGAVAFWILLGLSLLSIRASLRRRYPAHGEHAERLSFDLLLTEDAVVVDGGGQNGRVYLPWPTVAHAVEGEDAVEFYNRRQYIYVPKRCIEDMDRCRGIVDRCRRSADRKER